MFKIQTFNTISINGLNQFPAENYKISPDLSEPDAILVRSHNLYDVNIPQTVKVIGRAGAGINNIPIAEMTQRGIPVLNTPGANANAVREIVIAGMLLASRNLCQAQTYVRDLPDNEVEIEKLVEKNKKQFVGSEILGKTLGIIGLGNIGVKVANAAIHLGMNVIGFDPTITVSRAWELSANVLQAHNIEELLMRVDFISFHVPLNPETQNMMNASHFNLMKKNITLLNFARDGIIDNNALMDALNENRIHAYISDFPKAHLKNHPRVLSFPHLGASTHEAEENCAMMIANQVRQFLENGTIIHSVNFPAIEMQKNPSSVRFAIVNMNVPNMVAQISTILAKAELNIMELLNKSRGEIAYTLIDVNAAVNDVLLKEISSIKGVIQVRRI